MFALLNSTLVKTNAVWITSSSTEAMPWNLLVLFIVSCTGTRDDTLVGMQWNRQFVLIKIRMEKIWVHNKMVFGDIIIHGA